MEKFDIIIAGAGIAGLSAALTAVKHGMNTAVVEKDNNFGGIAKDCFHTYICGLFKNDNSKPFEIANPGICSDIFSFLHQCYGDQALVRMGKVETIAFIQKDLWGYFSRHLNGDNFTFYGNSRCLKPVPENRKIKRVTIVRQHKNKKQEINLTADIFVDATGSGYLSNRSKEYYSQLGGYCFLLQGNLKTDLSLVVPYTARKIVKKYNLNQYLKFVTITYNFLTKNHVLKFSVKNHDDMEKCQFIHEKLNEDIKEFSNLKFLKASKNIHSRGCGRMMQKALTHDKFHDTNCAVKSYWPIEKWDINQGTRYEYCKKDKPFYIPASALKDDEFDNLFLAGKNINVCEHINASARVMGICMATGEQAVINAKKYLEETTIM